jgi:hypothetical protein
MSEGAAEVCGSLGRAAVTFTQCGYTDRMPTWDRDSPMGKKLRVAAVVNGFAGLACFVAAIITSLVVFWGLGCVEFMVMIGCFAMIRLPAR